MDMIQKLRYRFLNLSFQKDFSIEDAIDIAEKSTQYIIHGTIPEKSFDYIAEQNEKEIYQETQKELDNVKQEETNVIKEYANIVLNALISDEQDGYSNKSITKIIISTNLSQWNASCATKYLKTHGYIQNEGFGSQSKWRILKNPDGTEFKPNSKSKSFSVIKNDNEERYYGKTETARSNAMKILNGFIAYEENGYSTKGIKFICDECNVGNGYAYVDASRYLKSNGFVEKTAYGQWKILKNPDGAEFVSIDKAKYA